MPPIDLSFGYPLNAARNTISLKFPSPWGGEELSIRARIHDANVNDLCGRVILEDLLSILKTENSSPEGLQLSFSSCGSLLE